MNKSYDTVEKFVEKPWGNELWLELNNTYCFKRLTVLAGKRTSLQYHEKKVETMYVLSGRGILTLEDPNTNQLVDHEVGPNDRVTIKPQTKHRVTGLTDIVYLEASTPEVDDVVRVADDTGRK